MEPTPSYASGGAIRIGDRITYAGNTGRVVFVINTRSFSDAYPEEEWSYLERGFMIEAEGYGRVLLDEADEDLILIERA